MRKVSSRALVAAAVGSALLSGCTSSIDGTANPPITNVTAEEFPITASTDSPVDQYARNAMADIYTFWEQAYPEFYGEDFTPLQGGIFAVDTEDIDESLYPDTGVGCEDLPIDPSEVEGNAFYQQDCDVVVYDSVLLRDLGEQYGAFLGPAVMAHEMGHAMQGRFGFSEASIRDETQADCFAGAFTRWVVDGNAQHVTVRAADLDRVLIGFIDLRDQPGSSPDDGSAHGSGFDRAAGFYQGYDEGVGACQDDFGPDRVFTATEFTTEEDLDSNGNAAYSQIFGIIDASLPVFYESFVPGFDAPEVATFDGTAPDCGDMGAENRDVGWCAADNTVYVDEADLLQPAYDEIGDFAVATALGLPYAEAARAALGLPTDTPEATASTVCLTGTYTARFFSGDFGDANSGVTLSPGDVDEAILFLLAYGQTDAVLPNSDAAGFELVGAFRDGFVQGAGACGLGA
ncbi:neutral zinc metallopeptidase [Blastococcus sp. SYSU D00695]